MNETLKPIAALLGEEVAAGRLMGAAVQLSHRGRVLEPVVAGRRRLRDPDARVEADTIFLIASITKPVVAAAAMKLIEEGRLALDDPVARHVPEFAANGKESVQVLHLLTHTSGLPDQIPENHSYRQAKRPLADWVRRICELPLAFAPGTWLSYQSPGFAMLGEICERLTDMALADFMRLTLFDPLGLENTMLRATHRSDRESDVVIPGKGPAHGGSGTDFDWNSDYWRGFGAPWGGMLTTVAEMTRLLLLFRNGGTLDGNRVLREASVTLMTTDHSSRLLDKAAAGRAQQRRGLGWRLHGQDNRFGRRVSGSTFGHGGATGTLAWVDPEDDVTCAIFTNDPDAADRLGPRLSDLVIAAPT